jgi:UDP-2,3-diacylglucosamine hydrolase
LPTSVELRAPEAWQRIEFLSDLHLSGNTPRNFDAFTAYLRSTTADAVFILGDLFDAWIGDDSRHEGFEAACVDVLREASAARSISFMAGNRDFLVGAEMLEACGVEGLQDPTVLCAFGERRLLSHGDALCVDDTAYQKLRLQVRNPAWQRGVLARPLAERRVMAQAMRTQSKEHQASMDSAAWADVDTATALHWLQAADASSLIHGHTHRPAHHELAPGLHRHVLSDWDFDHDGAPRGDILRWQADGLTRVPAADLRRPA